jgi:hypothetical protein
MKYKRKIEKWKHLEHPRYELKQGVNLNTLLLLFIIIITVFIQGIYTLQKWFSEGPCKIQLPKNTQLND